MMKFSFKYTACHITEKIPSAINWNNDNVYSKERIYIHYIQKITYKTSK